MEEYYRFGVIFCGKCGDLRVDSGFDTSTNLKCCKCGNTADFKIGRISKEAPNSEIKALLQEAVNDARIEKLRAKSEKSKDFTNG